MSSLDLGVRRLRSLELLLLMLLLILMVVQLLMVHPWGGTVRVMRETLTSCWVNGPWGKRLNCLL